MLWLHIIILIGTLILWAGGALGWIPYAKYAEKKDFQRFILILLAGNLLGMVLTWQYNRDRILSDDSYLLRPAPGEGNDTKEFVIEVDGQELAFSLKIPEQPGEAEEEEQQEEVLSEEEALLQAVQEAVNERNEDSEETEKYYLPSRVNGSHIQWSYPADHSGMMMVSLAALGGILLIASRESRKKEKEKKRKEQMVRDYPNLVTKLCLLVQAGMTMRRAFGKIALDYRKKFQEDGQERYAYEEMLTAYYEMQSGVMEAQAYEDFGRRCDEVKYRTLSTLMSQNLKKGSRNLIEMLEQESVEAFEDRKRQARIQGEAAATKLLFPMILMLVIVLIIIMVPAFLSF